MVNENECDDFYSRSHADHCSDNSASFPPAPLQNCSHVAPAMHLHRNPFTNFCMTVFFGTFFGRLTNESSHTRVMQQRGLDAYKQAAVNVTTDQWLTLTHNQICRKSAA